MEFKRNKETGIVEVWDKGKKIGEVITMGDMLNAGEVGVISYDNGHRSRGED